MRWDFWVRGGAGEGVLEGVFEDDVLGDDRIYFFGCAGDRCLCYFILCVYVSESMSAGQFAMYTVGTCVTML